MTLSEAIQIRLTKHRHNLGGTMLKGGLLARIHELETLLDMEEKGVVSETRCPCYLCTGEFHDSLSG